MRPEPAHLWSACCTHNLDRRWRCSGRRSRWESCCGAKEEVRAVSQCSCSWGNQKFRVSPMLSSCSYSASAASSTSSTSIASSTTSSPPTTSSAASATSTTATAVVFSNYEVPRPTSTSDTVALNCPALDQKNYTTARSQNFLMSCNVGLAGYDLVGIAAYIVDDCIEACSSMNAFLASSNNGTSVCTAITFNAAIYENWNQHANCWLKTKEDVTTSNGVGLLSAQLQGS
jgi:hypothetical protein